MIDKVSPVIFPTVDVWLAAWVRALTKRIKPRLSVTLVSNREHGTPNPGELHVILRDDGGTRHNGVLKDQQLGVTITANSVGDLLETRAFADTLVACMESMLPTDPDTPVADVSEVNGPYTVPTSDDTLRMYASMTLTLTGVEIAP